jgi:hypothetical protein
MIKVKHDPRLQWYDKLQYGHATQYGYMQIGYVWHMECMKRYLHFVGKKNDGQGGEQSVEAR